MAQKAPAAKRPPVDLERQARLGKPPGMPRPYDPAAEEKYPDLFQLLTLSAYSDGTERILPSLRVSREPASYVVCLQDHEMGRQCRAASPTLEGLWQALEAVLSNPLAWTTYKSPMNRSGEPFSLKKKKTGQAQA